MKKLTFLTALMLGTTAMTAFAMVIHPSGQHSFPGNEEVPLRGELVQGRRGVHNGYRGERTHRGG